MGLPKYKGLIDKLFEERVQQERLSMGNKQISLRNKVTKEIFEGLSEEQKADLPTGMMMSMKRRSLLLVLRTRLRKLLLCLQRSNKGKFYSFPRPPAC